MKRQEIEKLLDEIATHEAAIESKHVLAKQRSHVELVIATVLIQALLHAFERVLFTLYHQHERKLGKWFDEIENAALEVTRTAIASELCERDEALVEKGVNAVRSVFIDFRETALADDG